MKDPDECALIEHQLVRYDAIESLRQALDYSYRRFRGTARQKWKDQFADKLDPSDACVTVRCSGFLPSSEGSNPKPKRLSRPRFGY